MINIDKFTGRMGNRMFQYAYLYAQMRDGWIPDVYVQDFEYFDKYRDDLRKLFSSDIFQIDQVSIHVRRGDYVNNPFYEDLSNSSYYRDAMNEFPGASFLVISDDIEWCKKQDIFRDCDFAEGKDELEDFNFMAGCKGHIMANSSFSWWASYISGNKTVAPKNWFRDGVERCRLLPEWILI